MTMTDPVRVVMAADDGYARPLAVTGRSVIANLDPQRELELYVLDMGISAENRAAIERSLDDPRTTVVWSDSAVEAVKGLPTMGWFTTATYARLMIPDLLPASAHRAIYLDSDLVVRRSVSELYDLPFEGNVAVAVPDQGAPFVSCPWGLALWYEAGRNASDANFNCGVMLLDLDAWRAEGLGRQALEYVRSERYQLNVDQEAINSIVGPRTGTTDPHWNQQAEIFQHAASLALPYPRDVVASVVRDPWIIHYSLGLKPWMFGATHPWTAEWFTYLDQTAYQGWRPKGTILQRATWRLRPIAGRALRRAGLRT